MTAILYRTNVGGYFESDDLDQVKLVEKYLTRRAKGRKIYIHHPEDEKKQQRQDILLWRPWIGGAVESCHKLFDELLAWMHPKDCKDKMSIVDGKIVIDWHPQVSHVC